MDASHIAKSLFALTHRGIDYHLERIAEAANACGNAHLAYPAIHVAGTNGKGSTCSYIESILRSAGYTTGLFTSPHIVRFEERFRVNGQVVATDDWVAVYGKIQGVIEKYALTFFEATMLIASELFKEHNVDWAVFETGMGGRLDATNILNPEVSVITSLSIDHSDYLGTTLEAIAREKLGIIKERVPAVIAEPDSKSVRQLIDSICTQKAAPYTLISPDLAQNVRETGKGTSFFFSNLEFCLKMPGPFQVHNALLAVEAVKQTRRSIEGCSITDGINAVKMAGRFQVIQIGCRQIVFDVAHNPDAIKTLCTNLKAHFTDLPICVIAGIMSDKNYPEILSYLGSIAQHIIITEPAIERSAKVEMLAQCLPFSLHSVQKSVAMAIRESLKRSERIICVTGSFYTVSEAIVEIETLYPEMHPLIS